MRRSNFLMITFYRYNKNYFQKSLFYNKNLIFLNDVQLILINLAKKK